MRSSKEMQLWQQHMLQNQEIQKRQQQFQQIERGVRQQNLHSQVASQRQGVQNQLPPLLNGMPINRSSSYMLQNDIAGATANSSNIFMMPNSHGQAMHMQTGFASQQQFDPSLYGTPISSSRGLMSHYPQLQSMQNNYTDAMTNASMHSFTEQNVQAPGYQNMHSHTGWSNNMAQKSVVPTRAETSLDPEEEKILFGTHDASNLGSFLNDDSSDNGVTFGGFPSLNSGSWSALMQDAVQSSTSDKGLHEEWSGLSFRKPESSTANTNQVTWDNNSNNLQDVSIGPLPVFNDPSVKQMVNSAIQTQVQSNDASCGVWPKNMHDQLIKYGQGNCSQQESIPLFDTNNHSESNRTLYAQNGGTISTTMDKLQFSQSQSIPFSANTSNSNQETDQQALNRYHHDGKIVSFNSSAKSRGENTEELKQKINNGQQVQDLSINSADPSPSISDSQTSSGISGWKSAGPCKFQSPKDTAHSPSLPRSIVQQRKSQEQGYIENSQLKVGHAYSPEELQHRSSMSRNLRQLNSKLQYNQMQSASTGFNHSLHHPNEESQIENLEVKSDTSKQKCNEVPLIISERNALANNGSNLSSMGQQLQMWQQQKLQNQHQQQLLHNQRLYNASNHDSLANYSILRQAQISQNMAITNMSAQTSMPTVAGRILPFNIDSPSNLNSIDNIRTMQARQIDSPPMLHNVWTNISARGNHELTTSQQSAEGDKAPAEETSMNGAESETRSASQDQEKVPMKHTYINSSELSNLPSSVQQQMNYSLLKQMQAKMAFNTLSTDTKVLRFSSKENGEESGEKYATTNVQSQNQSPSLTSHFVGKIEKFPHTPQIAHSLFEQCRKYDAGNFGAMSSNLTINSKAANESSPQSQSEVTNDIIVQSKKRKIEKIELQPWHQVVSLGAPSRQNISMAEHRWAQATNRLIEKVEDTIEDSSVVPRARRRLTLTTELMQRLLPPMPATILAAKVSSAYESVTYIIAKEAIGDACSLICSCSGSGYAGDKKSGTSGEHKISKTSNEDIFSKVVEEFSERLKKLENIFSRLEKRTSIVETRLEWHEVEKFSLINRLGKMHARNQQAILAGETSSSDPRRIFQRFVTGSTTAYVPEGVQCFSL